MIPDILGVARLRAWGRCLPILRKIQQQLKCNEALYNPTIVESALQGFRYIHLAKQ